VFSLVACGGATEPMRLSGAIMGTTWHVSYVEEGAIPPASALQAGIEAQLARVDHSMSTYRADSEISQFNTLDSNTWFIVSGDFLRVVSTALDIGKRSAGAYDVTVGPLVDLWGFGPAGIVDVPPARDTIEEMLNTVGQQYLLVDTAHSRIMKERELALDFSSLAKGFAVDQVANWLLAQGVNRFMLEVGGEMRLSGLSARGDQWRIAIEQPESNTRAVAEAISLTDVAIATSGDYRNYFEANGKRYSHTIDPRTGYPIAHDLVSVTVVHSECMVADAWATALSVLGAERAMAVAKKNGLAVYFIRRVDDGYLQSHTPAFSGYLTQSQP
jgi:thiamine biosynthesis lipoprotein